MLESVETLNARLLNVEGKNTELNLATWRVVWSDEQYEKRVVNGVMLEVPKYYWSRNRYILERLILVPPTDLFELGGVKCSYEPVWVFEDRFGNPLPPKWEAIGVILDSIKRAAAKAVGVHYKNPEDGNDPIEVKMERVKKMEEALFGNESEVCDALAHKQAIVVPNKPFDGE